jgi:hypothetical protein
MRRWVAIGLAATIAAWAGCGDDSDERAKNQPKNTVPPGRVGSTHTIRVAFASGPEATKNDVQATMGVTLLAADLRPPKPRTLERSLQQFAGTGGRLIRVRLRVKNDGPQQMGQSTLAYQVVSSAGQQVDAEKAPLYSPSVGCCEFAFPGDELQPGAVRDGFVSFRLHGNFVPVKLRMTSPIGGKQVREWFLR